MVRPYIYNNGAALTMVSVTGALAKPPVTQVSVERLFSAMRLLLSDLRYRLKQDAVEAMLLPRTKMIST